MRLAEHFISFSQSLINSIINTRAGMLDSIYHMTLRLLLKSHFSRKKVIILSLYMQRDYGTS